MAAEPKGPKGLRLDFAGGAVGYRFRRGGERGHPLVKAAGLKKDRFPVIVDATAGLGRDAFLLGLRRRKRHDAGAIRRGA